MSRLHRVSIFASLISFIIAFAIISPSTLILSVFYFVVSVYTAWGVYHLILLRVGLKLPLTPKYTLIDYPKISLIIPIKDEPLIARTIEIILNHVDYPMHRKEIIIVTDDAEGERIAFWYQQKYPNIIKLLARRSFFPTKPSALNDALALCTGEIIGIIDAEDVPEKDTFIKAVSVIKNQNYGVAQVILAISNSNDSWIASLFSIEYAGWFRIWLNGRYRLGMYTPLGGTGNYFSHKIFNISGTWNSTNLAEDAELAIRLLISGSKTCVIDTRHWEEAPVNFNAWLKQRTRWFRGWLQSLWYYLLILPKPTLLKRIGIKTFIGIILMLIAPLIVVMNWVAYILTIYTIFAHLAIVPLFTDEYIAYISYVPLSFNALYIYLWFKGASLEGIKFKIRYIPYTIIYLNIMMPLAATRALYQEIFKSLVWEKTKHEGRGVHGFVLNK